MKDRRLSTPLVLASISAMICVGLVVLVTAEPTEPAEPAAIETYQVLVDTTTAERAAESFLDAWRKREHAVAASIAEGAALEQVEQRRRSDEGLSDEDRELKRRVWDAMATERLELLIRESENLPDGLLALRGTAEGTFLGQAYVRQVEFVVREGDEGWRVADATFGEILSDIPRLLREQ